MPVLDAKAALDADPEGAALLRSVLDTSLGPSTFRQKNAEPQKGEERAEIIDDHVHPLPVGACERQRVAREPTASEISSERFP